jgi:cytochrome c
MALRRAVRGMNRLARVAIWVAGLVLTALTAIGLAEGEARAQSSADRGEELFRVCAACHQIGSGARNAVGPILNNIVGRRIGSRSGFRYSPAMASAGADGKVWTIELLDAFLADPRAALRGNRMAFAGLRDPSQRADLIAYLATLNFDDPSESKILK